MASSPDAPSTPRRRPTFENPLYAQRNESGLYDSVAKQIEDMGLEALANLDYPDNITRRVEERSGHHEFLDSQGNELVVAVVGEVLGPVAGTMIRSQGNHFPGFGDSFNPVDDKTKVKDTVAIGIPTCASVRLHNTCLNQNIVLSQISTATADEDRRKEFNPAVKSWSKSLADREQHDILVITMQPKYGIPSAAGAPKVKRVTKRKLDEVDDIEAKPQKDDEPPAEPTGDDIKIGAFYDPALLPDFGGSYFNLQNAKLVQHDIRGTDGCLIPPWKIYDALKPGTLILSLVSLHVFLMDNKVRDNKGQDKRRVYQINGESFRILAESNEPVETRTRPIPPTSSQRVRAALPAKALASFNNFVIPSMEPSPSKNGGAASSQEKASADASTVDDITAPSTPKSSSSSATVDDTMDVDDTPSKKPSGSGRKRTKNAKD